MRKLSLVGIGSLAILSSAQAAPPPAGTYEAEELGRFKKWFQAQIGPLGECCELADGRMVDVRIQAGRYEVRFPRPETITSGARPDPNIYYPVANDVVLRVRNPTGHAIAWWSPSELFKDGRSLGRIRCFVSADLY